MTGSMKFTCGVAFYLLVATSSFLIYVVPSRKSQEGCPACVSQIQQLAGTLKKYEITFGTYPESLTDLTAVTDTNSTLPRDPWGRDFLYRRISRTSYSLLSFGRDGISNTADDVSFIDDY